MTKHQFAIRHKGKTLGVKDSSQLSRLLDCGEVDRSDKIFIIAEKRWISIEEFLSFAQPDSVETPPETPAPQSQEYAFKPKHSTQEFASLMAELTERSPQPGHSHGESEFSIGEQKTIHKLDEGKKTTRFHEPVSEAGTPSRALPSSRPASLAVWAAAVALVLGLAAGWYGSMWVLKDSSQNSNGRKVMQALEHGSSSGGIKN